MSNVVPSLVTCPHCGAQERATLFESVSADRLDVQRALIAEGRFELRRCGACEQPFQPEHPMLLADFPRGLWIVMHPAADRRRFATLEHGVEQVFRAQFTAAPPVVAAGVRGVRPRLVFGQDMLTEALRCADAHLDPALLECAKLLTLRRDMSRFVSWGPVELVFTHVADDGDLVHQAVSLSTRTVLEPVTLPGAALAETRAAEPALRAQFPDLFTRPYVSACRYLYGATI